MIEALIVLLAALFPVFLILLVYGIEPSIQEGE